MLRAGKWKVTLDRTWEKRWVCASVGRGEKKSWATIEYSPCHSKLTGLTAIRKLLSGSPPPLTQVSDLELPAIQECWPQQFPVAYHHRGCPCPGLLALWRGYTPVEQHQTPPAHEKRPAA